VQALDLQATVDEALKCDLLMETGQAQHGSGDQAGGQATFLKAIEAARRLQDSQRLAQAALGYALPYSVGNVDETVVSVLREALAAMPEEDSALRARLTGRLGREMYFGSLDDNARLTSGGIEMARRVGDKQALAEALWNHLWGSTAMLEGAEQRLPLAKEMILLAEEANDRQMAITGRWSVIATTVILGDMAAANGLIDELARVTEETRMPVYTWQLELLRGMQAMFSGTVAEAEERAQSALAIGQRATPDIAMQMFGAQIYAIRREQGRLAEMEAGIKGFAQMYPAVPSWRTALGFGYAELGRIEEARAELDALAKDDFAIFPRDGNWPIGMALLGETAAVVDDKERSAYLYDQLLPVADKCILVGAAVDCYGPTHRLLGRLATTLERWDDAERHFEDAMKMNARMGAGRFSGWAFHQYAEMLLCRDRGGDRTKALSLLSQALDVAERLGMTALLERSLKLKLKAQGVDLSDMGSSIDTVAREALAEQPDLKKHAAPDGTVTIMFSDIEGSTAMADRLGDSSFMDVLREHNAIIREQVKAHGGFEVKSEGDGFMVAFQSAGKALACASAIQKALATRNARVGAPPVDGGGEGGAAPGARNAHVGAPPGDGGGEGGAAPGVGEGERVMVRIGLHAGEVIKEGQDFFGRNVIMAARVASQAQGGEILASGVLKALLQGSDVTWGGSRTVSLKGLSGEHEIWAVEWA
jgi:class 3 adenylate cyclase